MSTKLAGIVAGCALLLAAAPPWAHHAFGAECDAKKPVKLQGKVTRVEWINPHAWIHIDAKNADGTNTEWMVEAGKSGTSLPSVPPHAYLLLGTGNEGG